MIPGNDSTPFSLASFQLSSFSSLLCWTLYFQVIGSELVGHSFGSGECGQAVGVSETMSDLSVPLFSNNPTLQALSFHQMALRPCTQYGLLLFSSIAKVLTYVPEYLGRIFSSSASSSAKASFNSEWQPRTRNSTIYTSQYLRYTNLKVGCCKFKDTNGSITSTGGPSFSYLALPLPTWLGNPFWCLSHQS